MSMRSRWKVELIHLNYKGNRGYLLRKHLGRACKHMVLDTEMMIVTIPNHLLCPKHHTKCPLWIISVNPTVTE